jgi:uncharacterized protein (DUF488 family)
MNTIDEQLQKNEGLTFFGGKQGFDYVCFSKYGKIECSGKLEDMIKYAEKFNYAVAMLIPVKFSNHSK